MYAYIHIFAYTSHESRPLTFGKEPHENRSLLQKNPVLIGLLFKSYLTLYRAYKSPPCLLNSLLFKRKPCFYRPLVQNLTLYRAYKSPPPSNSLRTMKEDW